MYEVIVTHRSDFREQLMGRFVSAREARQHARRLARQNHDLIIRAWVRAVRGAKSTN